jgi:phosphoglucomutase
MVFERVGLKHLYTVDAQMTPDGNFPTVKKPNPEYAAVFELGIEIAREVGSDLVIATDPDADRVGVMAKNSLGEFVTVSGNQMGALLLDYVIERRRALGKLDAGAYCVKSIVSTDMAYKIASAQGVKLYDVLTGFKYIGEVIKNVKNDKAFLLGFEESYGYLLGAYARDKDAVEASMMILEMAAYYKKLGKTLIDALEALYEKYGLYAEGMIDIYMEGLDGIEKRKRVMQSLRDNPPIELGGVRVVSAGDYAKSETKSLVSGEITAIEQPKSDVLYYTLENEDKIIVRPSGTEPKIKIYILAHGSDRQALDKKIKLYEIDAKRMTEV